MTNEEQITVGYYGKLPQRGDFLYFNINRQFKVVLDNWFQNGLRLLQSAYSESWEHVFMKGAHWRYAYYTPTISDNAFVGVIIPSLDRSGRYFPFSIMATLPLNTRELCHPDAILSLLEERAIEVIHQVISIDDLNEFVKHFNHVNDNFYIDITHSIDRVSIKTGQIDNFHKLMGKYFFAQFFIDRSRFSAWWTSKESNISELSIFKQWPSPEVFMEFYTA